MNCVRFCDGEVWVGPVTTQASAARQSAEDWAVNRARRHLGVERLGAVDEFDALGLGRHRHTEDWFTGGGWVRGARVPCAQH